MKSFSENLSSLPAINDLQYLELLDQQGQQAGLIENKPGSQGSLKVYHHLWQKHGNINATAAQEGLDLYAEHTADAKANPGKHPNIDRLLAIIEKNITLNVKTR